MALTLSVDKVDENGRELLTYGTPDFPIAFFDDDLTKVRVPPHWHDEFEIIIVTKGIVNVRIAGCSFSLKEGEGYFANSGILHSANLVSKEGHQKALVFSPRIISPSEDLVWKSYIAPVFRLPLLPYIKLTASVSWQKDLLSFAEKAWDIGAYDKKDYPFQVRYYLSKVFSLIVENSNTIENELHYTSRYQKDEIRVKKALLFIEKNYAEDITINDIAYSAGTSVSTCLRLFTAVVGTTPVKYLIRYRLQKAADEMKKSSQKTIAEAAYSCGFSDASYFNRCFKKMYSMTPGEYLSPLPENDLQPGLQGPAEGGLQSNEADGGTPESP